MTVKQAKVESRSIVLNRVTKLYKQTNKYDDEISHSFLCWDVGRGKNKTTYGISETDLHTYLNDPSMHAAKVWLMLKGSADFIGTLRSFIDGVSYVYDVDKKVLGVMFHDDSGSLWSV